MDLGFEKRYSELVRVVCDYIVFNMRCQYFLDTYNDLRFDIVFGDINDGYIDGSFGGSVGSAFEKSFIIPERDYRDFCRRFGYIIGADLFRDIVDSVFDWVYMNVDIFEYVSWRYFGWADAVMRRVRYNGFYNASYVFNIGCERYVKPDLVLEYSRIIDKDLSNNCLYTDDFIEFCEEYEKLRYRSYSGLHRATVKNKRVDGDWYLEIKKELRKFLENGYYLNFEDLCVQQRYDFFDFLILVDNFIHMMNYYSVDSREIGDIMSYSKSRFYSADYVGKYLYRRGWLVNYSELLYK